MKFAYLAIGNFIVKQLFMRKRVLFLLLLLISSPCFSSDKDQKILDSLSQLLTVAKESPAKVDLLNQLALKYMEMGMQLGKDSLKVIAESAIQLSRKLSYAPGLADALYTQGKYYLSETNSYDKATPCFLESLSIYEALNKKNGISKCYLQLGLISYILQYFEDAVKNFKISLTYKDEPTAKYLIALSYLETDSFLSARKYFTVAIQDYEEMKSQFRLDECYMYLGKLFLKKGDLDSAFYYLNKSIDDIQRNHDPNVLIRPYSFISSVYLKANKIDSAIYFAERSYAMAMVNLDEISLIEATSTLSKAYSIKGDYKKAFLYLDKLSATKDNFQKGSTKQKVADMQSMFDYNKRINDQKLKQQEEKALSQQQIQKEKILRNSFLAGAALLLLLLIVLYNRFTIKRDANIALQEKNEIIFKEKERSDALLLNILPSEVAEELKSNGTAAAKQFDEVTVMFTDFKGFTAISEKLTPSELVAEIHACFKEFDIIIAMLGIEKIKTMGDSYMCAGGLPLSNTTHAKDVVIAAMEIQHFMGRHLQQRKNDGKETFEMRIGIHTGPVVAGIVGVRKFAYDIWGDTVNIASRMESSGEAGKVNISGSTYELVKDKFNCIHRGKIQAKNNGEIDMYFVENIS